MIFPRSQIKQVVASEATKLDTDVWDKDAARLSSGSRSDSIRVECL